MITDQKKLLSTVFFPYYLFQESFPYENKYLTTYKPGEKIFNHNTPLNGIYWINSGVVQLITYQNSSKGFTVNLLEDGNYLEISSVFFNTFYHRHTAISLTKSEVFFLPKEKFWQLFQNEMIFRICIFKELSNQLNTIEDRIIVSRKSSSHKKLAILFLHLLKKCRYNYEMLQQLKISLQMIADLTGISKRYTCKVIEDFNRSGCIHFKNKQLQIRDLSLLKNMAEKG